MNYINELILPDAKYLTGNGILFWIWSWIWIALESNRNLKIIISEQRLNEIITEDFGVIWLLIPDKIKTEKPLEVHPLF